MKATLIRVSISLFLLLSLMAAPSKAAIKSGTKCKEVGKVVVAGGFQYKCVKKNKFLIWQKGKAVKKAAIVASPKPTPVVTPTPTPSVESSPMPTPTPTVKSEFFSFRYEKGVLFRKGNRESNWSTNVNAISSEIDEVRLKAFNEIKSKQPVATLANSSLRISFGDNVNDYFKNAYTDLIKKSMAYWDSSVPSNSTADVLVVTELDRSKVKPWLSQFVNGESDANRLEGALNYYLPSETSRNFSAGGSVTSMFYKTDPSRLVGAGYFHYGSRHIAEDLLMDNLAHEMTHWYQFLATPTVPKQNFYQDPSRPGVWLEREVRMACHLAEGSAVLFGTSILVDNAQWFSDGMDVITRRIQNQLPDLKLNSEADVVAELKKSESWLGQNCSSGYTLGALAYEWLIAERGIVIFDQVIKAHNSTTSVDAAIQKATGMTKDEFYKRAAPYVLKAWRKAATRN